MRIVSGGRRAITAVLAVIGLVAVVAALITQLFTYVRPSGFWIGERTVVERPSPDGEVTAFVVIRAGGGGLAPYCTASVYVGPARLSAADVADSEHSAFEGDCTSLQDADGISWTAHRKLRVQVGILSGPMVFRQNVAAAQVDVQFVVRE